MHSSSTRPLAVRKRPDLFARRQSYQGQQCWVVKDPVGMNFFQLQDEEYAVLQMLDGRVSLEDIQERFQKQFTPRTITLEEIHRFLGMLHQSGLVISEVPGQGDQLYRRRGERRRKKLLAAFSNILAIRFRGFDPERLLNRMYPYFRWCFWPGTVALCVALCLAALASVIVHFDTFVASLPEFQQFFGLRNAFLLLLTLGVTKILHEFGHGLTCKHFGGECHELGFMLLVLTPCLYCDVTDSWLLPSKWRRAAIAAAGIFVEVVLASIATFVWWFTEPGLVHYMALNVMFIGSVSTVLFNGNPLLRYDGYYILSDLVEIPNLRQKASKLLSRKAGEWLLGIEPPDEPELPRRNQVLFIVYSVAAVVYRWFILFSILFFLHSLFKAHKVEIVGKAMIAMSLVGLVGVPLYQFGKFLYTPGNLEKIKRKRTTMTIAGLFAIGAVVFLVPLPHRVLCPFEVQAHDADAVYVAVPGSLKQIAVRPGETVARGQVLARLEDLDLDLRIAELEGLEAEHRTRLENLAWRRHRDVQAALELHEVEEALKAVAEQLAERRRQKARLVLAAPRDGTVIPPPDTPAPPPQEGALPGWSGMPLDEKNVGCLLDRGVLFCQVGDPEAMEALLVIDQGEVDLVREGQTVEILLDEMPYRRIRARGDEDASPLVLEDLSQESLETVSKQLSVKSGGELPTKTDASGVERPMSPSYHARVYLGNRSGLLHPGLRGTAKIHTAPLTLAARAWRLLMRTINFRL